MTDTVRKTCGRRENLGRKPTAFPRGEIPSHEKVIEASHPNQFEEFCYHLLYDALLHVVALQTLPHLVQQVEDVIHAERWLAIGVEDAIEQTSAAVTCDETW